MKDGGILREFKSCDENSREELEETIIGMYSHIAIVRVKNLQLTTIQEGSDDIKRWITENPNTLIELPRPLVVEIRVDYASLDRCQQAGKIVKNETSNSLSLCTQLHKATKVLTHKSILPPIKEIKKTISMEKIEKI
jgi:hypothetical protein